MYALGYDIGSSFIKASLVDLSTGSSVASGVSPDEEMRIEAPESHWAEQDPDMWWENLKEATYRIFRNAEFSPSDVKAIGISYQMHGLVPIDSQQEVLRPSIIWCDSRAVETGNKAFREMGEEKCLKHLLNSPGNFTASKLGWVKVYEPKIFSAISKILLPGDYIAMKFTGEITTTPSGLSEGIFWDFKNNGKADFLLDYFGFNEEMFPQVIPNFSSETGVSAEVAKELGIPEGTPVSYRAGDQPNNALSLNVLKPGEIAATAGTSGVVYGVSDEVKYDPRSRVNTFLHVNHTKEEPRLGVLLCINGTGSLNSWLKRNAAGNYGYEEMNELASKAPIGSEGLVVLPFGNGAERVLNNANPGSSVHHLNFNIHEQKHLFRAAQEGIVFAFQYGLDIMKDIGIQTSVIRAGNANMFLSPVFRTIFASISNATIELYNTDGAQGAARGAAIGAGYYDFEEAFSGLKKVTEIEPDAKRSSEYQNAYKHWKRTLEKTLAQQ
ncbi:MAG: carbohydrate kinase [Bacteroidales bacterium]|nr:carbohydrate kinase [Bacteroidales bacterium]